jgi:hypothetical protein
MLVLAIVMHQFFDRVMSKVEIYPLRRILLRCSEFFGRILCFPTVTFLYIRSIGEISAHSHLMMIVITAGLCLFMLPHEWISFKQEIRRGLDAFIVKLNDRSIKFRDLSTYEIFFFNLWRLHVLSLSVVYMEEMLLETGRIDGAPSWGIFENRKKDRKHLNAGIKEHHLLEPEYEKIALAAAEDAKQGEPEERSSESSYYSSTSEKSEGGNVILRVESTSSSKKTRRKVDTTNFIDPEKVEEASSRWFAMHQMFTLFESYFDATEEENAVMV